MLIVFNATFNTGSAISWLSVSLVEETGTPRGLELITLFVMGSDCTGGCKSNYHAITTTTLL